MWFIGKAKRSWACACVCVCLFHWNQTGLHWRCALKLVWCVTVNFFLLATMNYDFHLIRLFIIKIILKWLIYTEETRFYFFQLSSSTFINLSCYSNRYVWASQPISGHFYWWLEFMHCEKKWMHKTRSVIVIKLPVERVKLAEHSGNLVWIYNEWMTNIFNTKRNRRAIGSSFSSQWYRKKLSSKTARTKEMTIYLRVCYSLWY